MKTAAGDNIGLHRVNVGDKWLRKHVLNLRAQMGGLKSSQSHSLVAYSRAHL